VPGSPWRGIRGAPGGGKLLLDGFRPQYARIGAIEMLQATEEARSQPRTPRQFSMAQLHRHLQAVVMELAAIGGD
jgi:hypothetical protein